MTYWASAGAFMAITGMVGTATSLAPVAKQSDLASVTPMRRPVNEPGPDRHCDLADVARRDRGRLCHLIDQRKNQGSVLQAVRETALADDPAIVIQRDGPLPGTSLDSEQHR